MPATVFPSREAYETFLENNLTASNFHLRTIGIVGRQCHNATVGTTAEQRSSNPPKMAPWEYRTPPPRAPATDNPGTPPPPAPAPGPPAAG